MKMYFYYSTIIFHYFSVENRLIILLQSNRNIKLIKLYLHVNSLDSSVIVDFGVFPSWLFLSSCRSVPIRSYKSVKGI